MSSIADHADEAPLEPKRVTNPPGSPALSYRLGTHPTFLARMRAALRGQVVPDTNRPPLAALTLRDDDPAVALLDAWAVAADVITFYQERIANEGYLRTAAERRSALELGRAVGYELRPGVAASALLAFTVEEAPGAPAEAVVPAGTRVQSIPRQGKLPQTFETGERLVAAAKWNALRPRLRRPQVLRRPQELPATQALLRGTATGLQPGDAILIVGGSAPLFRSVTNVELRPRHDATLITWSPKVDQADLPAPGASAKLLVFRRRAAIFGNNAPDLRLLSKDSKNAFFAPKLEKDWPSPEAWPGLVGGATVRLDAGYPQIQPGSWAVLSAPGATQIFEVTAAQTVSVVDYFMSANVTMLTFSSAIQPDGAASPFPIRATTVYAQSEELALAEQPIDDPLEVDAATGTIVVELDRIEPNLRVGQALALSGELDGSPGATAAEIVTLIEARHADVTTLLLRATQRRRYVRATVSLNANVVAATHGETIAREVLGSGDGRQINHSFKLGRSPLTYHAAPTSSGAASTLEVRVDDVRWREVPALVGLGPRDQVYTLRHDHAGATFVIFGDGINGARLPSGQENVVARYRSGLGPDGNVDAGALTLLQTRPLGIRSVTNPDGATGGAAPETLNRARDLVPRAVLTLGRLVSRQDYEDFARGFAGIGQAQATTLWSGETRLIYVSVADVDGNPVAANSDLQTALAGAMHGLGNPLQRVRVEGYTPLHFDVSATVWVDQRFDIGLVVRTVRQALVRAFAFERRSFGQDVAASEVITVVQAVAGVVAVDLDRLARHGDTSTADPPLPADAGFWPALRAEPARVHRDRFGNVTFASAQMWRLDEQDGVEIKGLYAPGLARPGEEQAR